MTSLVFSSLLSLPSTVPSTTEPHALYVVKYVESINNFHVSYHHHSISRPSWRKFQPKWYILMLATSMVFSSRLSLPFKLSLTTNSHLLYVVRHVESTENCQVNHQHHDNSISTMATAYHIVNFEECSGGHQCPAGTRTRPATWYLFWYPTRFSFRNHWVAGNPKHRVLPDISGIPEVSGTTRYSGYHP